MVARGNRNDRDESASDRARRPRRIGSDRRRLWRQLLVVLRPGRGHDHHLGPDGEDHLRRRLDRSRGGALRERDQGVQQELPERPRHVQAGRRQPAHRALDRRRRGQPAGHGRHRATGPDPGVRQQEGAAADRLRQADDGEELRPGVDPARHVQRHALQRRLQGEQQVTRLVQRPRLHGRRREAADDVGPVPESRVDRQGIGHDAVLDRGSGRLDPHRPVREHLPAHRWAGHVQQAERASDRVDRSVRDDRAPDDGEGPAAVVDGRRDLRRPADRLSRPRSTTSSRSPRRARW